MSTSEIVELIQAGAYWFRASDNPPDTMYMSRRDYLYVRYGRHGYRFRKTNRTTWGRVR